MKVSCVQFDVNTFGITQRSLKMLRNVLASRIDNYIVVVEVPTNDLCCGYMILDRDAERAIWTGDGFRMDRRGEGGAGYVSAKALLELYDIDLHVWNEVNFDEVYVLPKEGISAFLLRLGKDIAEQLAESDFERLSDNQPQYLRGR